MNTEIEGMVGKVPVQIYQDDDEIKFLFNDDSSIRFYHQQDCCECVEVEDVNGNWDDLIGYTIFCAEERTEDDPNADESGTWTFYTFRTLNGSVDVRWYGTSNGYYSEGVHYEWTNRGKT